jgi:exopolysaccharide biosynthesis protein
MKIRIAITGLGILLLNVPVLLAQIPGFEKIAWQKEKIKKGLSWKYTHTSLFDSPQNINILEINLRKRSVNLVYHPAENIPTSRMAMESNSLAAINAGFFDMKDGGSVTFIKVDGKVPDADSAKWRKTETRNGALIIKTDGTLKIEHAQNNGSYIRNAAYDDVLVTGPVLVQNGNTLQLPSVPFVNLRHPRSCLCLDQRNTLKLITTDGRSEQAAGMSLTELAQLAISLQCKDAINLDGGGSTTLWIRGEGGSGVVNMPSDNRKFDHAGERNVSNVIVVH